MYHELCDKLYVAANGSEYLPMISMEGYNAVCVDTTVFTGATVTITLMSNDGANWTTAGSADTLTVGPVFDMSPHSQFGQISARYVRVKVSTNATAAIVSIGINCTNIGA